MKNNFYFRKLIRTSHYIKYSPVSSYFVLNTINQIILYGPWVSKTSKVFFMSKIDFTPAHTTVTGVLPNSVRSAEMSIEVSAPLCTPPMPPVANI